MPRAKLRTPELRVRLLTGALDLLADHGPAGLTARRVAEQAQTSPPAVYELFGDKGGLVREVFFEGWRLLAERLAGVPSTDDPLDDLLQLASVYRMFLAEHPVLAEVMLARPFVDFDPAPHESAAGAAVRRRVVRQVRRCVAAGRLEGDATDVAHALVALVQGLAASERARRLGGSPASIERRWRLAVDALLTGLAPAGS